MFGRSPEMSLHVAPLFVVLNTCPPVSPPNPENPEKLTTADEGLARSTWICVTERRGKPSERSAHSVCAPASAFVVTYTAPRTSVAKGPLNESPVVPTYNVFGLAGATAITETVACPPPRSPEIGDHELAPSVVR